MHIDPKPPDKILIREANTRDTAAVVQLIRQLGNESEISEEYVVHYLSGMDRCILLAEWNEVVVGLLSYSTRADLFHAGNSVLIEELVVDAEYRSKGIGGALLNTLMMRLEEAECKEVCLAVMPDNKDAIRFYKRYGLAEEALFLEMHL